MKRYCWVFNYIGYQRTLVETNGTFERNVMLLQSMVNDGEWDL